MSDSGKRVIRVFIIFILLIPLIPLIIWSVVLRWDFPEIIPSFDFWVWNEIGSDKIFKSIAVSVPISLTVVVIAFFISFFPAKIIGTSDFKLKGFIEALLMVMAFIPQISIVFGIQKVFRFIGLYSTILGIIVTQLIFQVPYLTLLMSAVFRAYDIQIEEQARCLGATNRQIIMNITLPAVRPGIIVGCIFSFIGSWGNYLLTAVIGPPSVKTLPVLLFPMMSSGNNSYPIIAAITIIYIVPVIIFMMIALEKFTEKKGFVL